VRVKALKSFSLGQGVDVHRDDLFQLPEDQAREKIARGWVVEAEPVLETTEAEPEDREPARRARRGE